MEIEIIPCFEGAARASGIVIIVDVFRAGNTVSALLARGAPFVRPVADLEEARCLGADHPEWLMVGERGGLKPDGFEMNNSPAEAWSLNLAGRPALLTTSAGTRGLTAAAAGAEVLLMATLINARAAAAYVSSLSPERVTIVPMGLEARERAVEDDVVAEYLADLIKGRTPDYRATVRAMLGGSGAGRLRRLGQWRDLAFCLKADRLGLVPLARKQAEGLVLIPVRPAIEADRP
ncbi:MAG: 2-phosphosulfolactate phosphatase [Proteobacteria bacterium]|nr:2-phosphosulfolactate phosphatase [Pseudomonadota bacterium]